jgi:hypothetical protein
MLNSEYLEDLGIKTSMQVFESYNIIELSKIVGFEKTAPIESIAIIESESDLTETEIFCEGGVSFMVNETLENLIEFLSTHS